MPASARTNDPAPTTVHHEIWQRFRQLVEVKRRLYVVRPFSDELDRARRGKPFRMRNDIVWNAMLDVRDKLVIDLCSLCQEMRHGMKPLEAGANESRRFLGKRGFFFALRDRYRSSLRRSYVPHPDDDEYEIVRYTESNARRFEKLFPNCRDESPSADDIEQLCERFRLRTKPLVDDRNKNRAHAYEAMNDVVRVPMLWVPELTSLFEDIEQLLEDLSLLCGGACFVSDNMNHADCDATAADLVDMVLLGHIDDVRRLTNGRTREELYARLHEIDDSKPIEYAHISDLHFNDRQFVPPFVEPFVALAADA